jgi:hypothetical protein
LCECGWNTRRCLQETGCGTRIQPRKVLNVFSNRNFGSLLLFRPNWRMDSPHEAGQDKFFPEVPPCRAKYCESSFFELTEPDRLEIIREAEVPDDRPSLLRGDAEDGPVEEADSWVTQNGAKILPHLLRRMDPSDSEMVQLVQSGMFPLTVACWSRANLLFDLATRPCPAPSTVGCHFPNSQPPH